LKPFLADSNDKASITLIAVNIGIEPILDTYGRALSHQIQIDEMKVALHQTLSE